MKKMDHLYSFFSNFLNILSENCNILKKYIEINKKIVYNIFNCRVMLKIRLYFEGIVDEKFFNRIEKYR